MDNIIKMKCPLPDIKLYTGSAKDPPSLLSGKFIRILQRGKTSVQSIWLLSSQENFALYSGEALVDNGQYSVKMLKGFLR